jgi:hypothetical protein
MLGPGGTALRSRQFELERATMNRMQQWWRKWSYEIPLAFGDALWDVLVVQFADFLSRLTIRRVLKSVAIAILVMAFMQTFPIELAMLAAGDTLTYLEIAVIIRLAAGREMFRQMLRLAIRFAGLATRGAKAVLGYSASGIARLREPRDAAAIGRSRRKPASSDQDDVAATVWGHTPAFA